METKTWFYLCLVLTALAIVAVVVTGKQGMRRPHLVCVIGKIVFLFGTIYMAYQLKDELDFPELEYAIHMPLARVAFVALFGPLITGILYWRGSLGVGPHRKAVGVYLVAVAAALGSGVWMILGATPK